MRCELTAGELDADIAKVLRFYKQRSQEIQQLLELEKARSAEVGLMW